MADLNGSGLVDGADLGVLLAAWGPAVEGEPADIDGNGVVNGADLGVLLAAWGNSLVDCIEVESIAPAEAAEGETVILEGSFPDPNPLNYCAVALTRENDVIPFEVIGVTPTALTCVVGPSRPGIGPGLIMVGLGVGSTGGAEYPVGTVGSKDAWSWSASGPGESYDVEFTPIDPSPAGPPGAITGSFFGDLVGGELCVTISGDCPPGTTFQIIPRAHHFGDGTPGDPYVGYDCQIPCLEVGGVDEFNCAQLICQAIEAVYLAHHPDPIVIDCSATSVPDGTKLTLALPGLSIDWGMFTISVLSNPGPCAPGDACPDADHDCYTSGGPGCTDAACCDTVCALDPFCCDTAWDGLCVAGALDLCGTPGCSFVCDGVATPEGEPCGRSINDGCDGDGTGFTTIACGETICANAWSLTRTFDSDWYALELATASEVSISLAGALPMQLDFAETGGIPDCARSQGLTLLLVQPYCGSVSTVVCLQPGTHWFRATPLGGSQFACGTADNAYQIAITCVEDCPPPGCSTADHDCLTPGSPGCTDLVCCDIVCTIDVFCCEAEWDALCVKQALDFCYGMSAPENDECDDRIAIGLGDTPFSTISATTDGPDLPSICDEGFGLALVHDIWFSFVATQTATLVVSTCNAATYDTRLAAYEGARCLGPLVACNDDGSGCVQFTSSMEFPTVMGETYVIRVGGFAGMGSGTLSLTY